VQHARRYAQGGGDGLIVENEGDIPFLEPDDAGPPGPRMSLLSASVKSPGQALQAFSDGAPWLTSSWEIIRELMVHPLTDSAVAEFARIAGARP
jgi:hypothetical protein